MGVLLAREIVRCQFNPMSEIVAQGMVVQMEPL